MWLPVAAAANVKGVREPSDDNSRCLEGAAAPRCFCVMAESHDPQGNGKNNCQG
jgi:hypothetical protein